MRLAVAILRDERGGVSGPSDQAPPELSYGVYLPQVQMGERVDTRYSIDLSDADQIRPNSSAHGRRPLLNGWPNASAPALVQHRISEARPYQYTQCPFADPVSPAS